MVWRRYLWNLALVSAIQPVLHTLEVAFRNEIARAATRLTQSRTFRHCGSQKPPQPA